MKYRCRVCGYPAYAKDFDDIVAKEKLCKKCTNQDLDELASLFKEMDGSKDTDIDIDGKHRSFVYIDTDEAKLIFNKIMEKHKLDRERTEITY